MNKIELFANYALRDLLPLELKKIMNGEIEGTKGNTILIQFKETAKRDTFLTICNRYGFKTRIVLNK